MADVRLVAASTADDDISESVLDDISDELVEATPAEEPAANGTVSEVEAVELVEAPLSYREELERTVLGGLASCHDAPDLLPSRIAHAHNLLEDTFFTDRNQILWKLIMRYHTITSAIPSPPEFNELLEASRKLRVSDRVEYGALYYQLATKAVTDSRFRYSCMRLAERWRDEQFTDALATAQDIQVGSSVVEGKALSGYEDAVTYLRDRMNSIERQTSEARFAEGDLNQEGGDLLSAYDTASHGTEMGIRTGFNEIDGLTHGIQAGELVLIAGFTGTGKSKISYNIAWNACYMQGKNVLFGTAEAARDQVRRNIVVRHSRHPKFGKPEGLKYSDVRHGTLSPEDREVYRQVILDLKSRDYGRMFIFQVPHRSTVANIADTVDRQLRVGAVDLIIVDYLGLLTSSVKRASRREELDDLLIAAKRLATDTNKGRGCALVSPWQIRREAWVEAQKAKEYTMAALAETAQAERSTDLILSILTRDDVPNTLRCQVLKSRDSEAGLVCDLETDYTTSYVGSSTGSSGLF